MGSGLVAVGGRNLRSRRGIRADDYILSTVLERAYHGCPQDISLLSELLGECVVCVFKSFSGEDTGYLALIDRRKAWHG